MYTGTLINDLFVAVEKAERLAETPVRQIQRTGAEDPCEDTVELTSEVEVASK